jgi:hypothetical protein
MRSIKNLKAEKLKAISITPAPKLEIKIANADILEKKS